MSFLYPVNWPWHKIPPNYATVSAGPEVTRAPHHLRNSTCLAHGRSHGSFPVGMQRAIKKVPPLGIHTLLDFFYLSTRHRISDDINYRYSLQRLPSLIVFPCSTWPDNETTNLSRIFGQPDWRDVGSEDLTCLEEGLPAFVITAKESHSHANSNPSEEPTIHTYPLLIHTQPICRRRPQPPSRRHMYSVAVLPATAHIRDSSRKALSIARRPLRQRLRRLFPPNHPAALRGSSQTNSFDTDSGSRPERSALAEPMLRRHAGGQLPTRSRLQCRLLTTGLASGRSEPAASRLWRAPPPGLAPPPGTVHSS